ncbi:acyl-CoA dehydrogenase family protein [Amycolatopsis panacis]|uniref:Acyl-CoA dehydrogenase n=1 Tax=Amycolatopsis panacis TaxID=2340917 RepID=A0A419HZN2_9PSEU|nr:acyl-CoA dehydrogenase family protein [Amycolatopsis panacis]RJQ82697.1 acyl-CoA dehydrogenase [Amycolatopsis panacis]
MKWNDDVYDVADQVFAERRGATAETRRGDTALWQVLLDLGWPYVAIDENAGGVGGDLTDLAEIVRAAGRHNALVPLAETSVAAWIFAHSGGSAADLGAAAAILAGDSLTWTTSGRGVVVNGSVQRVAWAGAVPTLLLVREDSGTTTVGVVRPAEAEGLSTVLGRTPADEPCADLRFDSVRVAQDELFEVPLTAGRISDRDGVLRAAAIFGAVERAVEHSAQHVATRHQFGRPLVKLQAVQHLLASIICERDLLGSVVRLALATGGAPGATASAAATAGRVAHRVAAVAHQLHGAIGITREHDLHLSTSRLTTWAESPRSQRSWELRLGALAVAPDDEALWELTTSGSELSTP